MNYVSKTMICVLETMICLSKTITCVLKTMKFGKALLGTKRVEGKITYFFSRISGVYSEISQFAEQHLTVTEKTGFSTIDKLVYLQQTQLFHQMVGSRSIQK